MLRKNPGFTAVAACSLAIGIGANSAIFSFADAMLLRPLPVMKPGEVVNIASGPTTFGGNRSFSYPDYLDFRDRNRTFDGLVAYQYGQFGYAPDPSVVPEMQFGVFVSGNLFRVLGVEPTIGRGFRASEDKVPGRDRVVVISHDFGSLISTGPIPPSVLKCGSTVRNLPSSASHLKLLGASTNLSSPPFSCRSRCRPFSPAQTI